MEGSTFLAALHDGTRKCTDISTYAANARLGVDSVDFLLLHGTSAEESHQTAATAKGEFARTNDKGGKVDTMASSGEKARILLAIECELPGSIGAANLALSWNETEIDLAVHQTVPPVAVIYDEIDAHVGGRAAVAMANMLADQASETATNGMIKGQVVSITHCSSVAAIADMHILVQRQGLQHGIEGKVQVTTSSLDGAVRRKELARMASGDLAADEAETFADALLRDGNKRRRKQRLL
jgi:DNA repair ATPase RecN